MSETRFKFVVRAYLPHLTGVDREVALAYFRPKVGNPDEYYDNLDWHYDPGENAACPVKATDADEWGIDVVLAFGKDAGNDIEGSIDIDDLEDVINNLRQDFPELGRILIMSYTWYTGVDEPISFEWARERKGWETRRLSMTLNKYLDAPLAADATMIEKACAVAEQAHAGQKRWNGDSYITHPTRVAESFCGLSMAEVEDERVVAFLHDVVEDTGITLEQLREFGFSEEQVEAIDSVTKREGQSYLDFVLRAKANPIGCRVKIADIKDNLNDLNGRRTGKNKNNREKYQLALWILENGCE